MEPLSILTLQNISGIGNTTLRNISSLPNIVEPENSHDLYKVIVEAKSNFNRIPAVEFSVVDNAWNKAIEIIDLSEKNDIKIIGRNSPYYPPSLSKIDNPPELLHIKGNIEALKENCVAIIGTRNPTEDGLYMAKNSGEGMAKNGYAVVSGLAKGIDTAAHEGALKANGRTIAVLAHGLDTVYPKQNEKLAEKIIENHGALISEYFYGKKSTKSSFVERDRIQSGLSLSVLVIETAEKGGTMHTVKFCTEQEKLLLVFEPPIDPSTNKYYSGNNQLIKNKLADFIMKYDNNSLNCFFTYNYFRNSKFDFMNEYLNTEPQNKYVHIYSRTSFKSDPEKSQYYIDIKKELESKLKSNAITHFVELISTIKFACKKDCQNCEHFNDCKLIDQGFSELCPFKEMNMNKLPPKKETSKKKNKSIYSY